MTHEEFKAICLTEYPKIEAMVKTVKALGVHKVSCDVYADGHINFDIAEVPAQPKHASYHNSGDDIGRLQIIEWNDEGNAEWKPVCYYDHAIDNDTQ